MRWDGYTKSERTGLLILAGLMVTGITIWQLLYHFGSAPQVHSDSLQQQWEIFQKENITWRDKEDLEESENEKNGDHSHEWKEDSELTQIPYAPRKFDPNTAPIETMIAAGVPLGSAKRIIRYRNKGGKFYNKEKLKNFGFSESEYAKVVPYISIHIPNDNNTRESYTSEGKYVRVPEPGEVYINSTDEEELMRFRGIGPGFSKRIIAYRNKLGGFHKVEQLKEVYGLPDSTYLHIGDRIIINAEGFRKIDINQASEEELAAHPYIGKFMAANIVRLRKDMQSFRNISDLRQVPLINEEKYRKIVPYIQL